MADTAAAQTATPATNAPAAPATGATAGTTNASADQNATSRGLPYYEKLRRELRDTIANKRAMDRCMVSSSPARLYPNAMKTLSWAPTAFEARPLIIPPLRLKLRVRSIG